MRLSEPIKAPAPAAVAPTNAVTQPFNMNTDELTASTKDSFFSLRETVITINSDKKVIFIILIDFDVVI